MTKFAVVGLGYWGPNLLRNLVANAGGAQVVAVDQSVDRLAETCAHYPTVACASSLEQALDEHDIGGVLIATPVSTHHHLARTALDAGCHVLVEKPLAASTEEAEDLVTSAEAARRTLMVGHTFLFSPRVDLIHELVTHGRLGNIQYVTSARLNLGLHQADVSVIWDLAPHDLSIIFHILGEFPETVRTSGRAVVHTDRPDVAFITLTFPSGVVALVSISWLAPSKARNMVVVGDEQMLVYDDIDNEQPIKLYDKGVIRPEPGNFGEHQLIYRHGDMLAPHVVAQEPLAREVAHFLACAAGVQMCRCDGWFGLGVVRVLEAAERSWNLGGDAVPLAPLGGEPRPTIERTRIA